MVSSKRVSSLSEAVWTADSTFALAVAKGAWAQAQHAWGVGLPHTDRPLSDTENSTRF